MKEESVHSINTKKGRLSLKYFLKNKWSDIFPYVEVSTATEYFLLPKNKREKFGIYLLPSSLPSELFHPETDGWRNFNKVIRKEYPIQGWFREWFLSIDSPIYWIIYKTSRLIKDYYRNIKRFFKPSHPRFRKAYPRHKWHDLTEAIVDINFALILDFWHEEIGADIVNWDATVNHSKFYNWIKDAVYWIERARPEALKQLDNELTIAHNNKNNLLSYEQRYGKHNRLEKYIDETDNEILKKMIDYRGFFWT